MIGKLPFKKSKTKEGVQQLQERIQWKKEQGLDTTTWCPMPWIGLSVRSVGDLRYCCHAHKSPGKGLLKDNNGHPLTLKNHSIEEGLNSPQLKDVRKKMLAGDRPEGCIRCYQEESAGIFSRRQNEQLAWKEFNEELFQSHTEDDGSISTDVFPIRYLDLRFGNRCNLKCRMCGPTESDKWYELTPKVWDTNFFKEGDRKLEIIKNEKGQYGLRVDPYQWYESPKFWKNLETHLPKLQRIYLAGGEPLLIESQFDFLQLCIDRGYAKNITLEYNSNITALTSKILKIWSHFRKVEIGMSIDGVGDVNDYIRTGSSWPQIEKNLQTLDGADGTFKLWWASTIQIYNFLQLPEMMKWIVRQKFERINQSNIKREIFTPHPLSNPQFLSITTFSPASKLKIQEFFEDEKSEISEYVDGLELFEDTEEDLKKRVKARFNEVLDNYIRIMNAQDTSHLKEKFWAYTNKLDEIHGSKFKDVAPVAHELML